MQRTAVTIAVAIGLVIRLSESIAIQVCPTPQPCHCIGATSSSLGGVVACSFLRLEYVPYFLVFDSGVWNELDLAENLLDSISPSAFNGVRVHQLRLDRNNIRVIDDEAFHGIGLELETIDLSHNRLIDIRLCAIFHSLVRLHTLRLRYNHLAHITTTNNYDVVEHTHMELPALVELDLTGNDLDRVPTKILTSLPQLHRLILRDNRIRYVGESAFAGAGRLEYVDLGANRGGTAASGNRQMKIDTRAFCGLEPRAFSRQPGVTEWVGLQSLKLDHNGLSGFDACSLVGIWTLTELQLTGNPLNCDCRLLNGLHRLTESFGGFRLDPSTSGSAQCATPASFAGLTLQEAVDTGFCDDVTSLSSTPCIRLCGAAMLLTSSKLNSASRTGVGLRIVLSWPTITICLALHSKQCSIRNSGNAVS